MYSAYRHGEPKVHKETRQPIICVFGDIPPSPRRDWLPTSPTDSPKGLKIPIPRPFIPRADEDEFMSDVEEGGDGDGEFIA